jgi:Leucine-rich repeat (LRR) protein
MLSLSANTYFRHIIHYIRCGTAITDVKPLANLIQLDTIYIDANRLRDISSLAALTKLSTIILRDNELDPQTCPFKSKSICHFD